MQGVVFDFDGVIARSMEAHAEAYRRTLAPLGIAVSDRDVFLREGARSETIIRDLTAAGGHDLDDDEVQALAERKQAQFGALDAVTLYGGAAATVREVAGHVPVALVTGTRRSNLDRLVPELLPVFTAILAQEDYSRDKPDPEPYARAAVALDIPAAALVCVENARRGVQSARAAGYGHIVALTTTMRAEDFDGEARADFVAPNHAALLAHLRDVLSL